MTGLSGRMRLNESKLEHIDLAYKQHGQIPITTDNDTIPYSDKAKYLGMNLDVKLQWKGHGKKKSRKLECKYRKKYWLTDPPGLMKSSFGDVQRTLRSKT